MKRIFIFLILGLFLISFTSAVTRDNTAYYTLDENTGTSVADNTSNGYDGVASNTRVFTLGTNGIINSGANFSGDGTDLINISTGVPTGDMTISLWINPQVSNDFMFSLGDADTSFRNLHIKYFGNKINLGIWGNLSLNSEKDVDINTWYHVVLQRYANETIKLYLNGTLSNESNDGSFVPTDYNLILGHSFDSQTSSSSVDEVGIWDRILTDAEITDLYNSGDGISYLGISAIPGGVSLNSPINATIISDLGTNFTSSGGNATSVSANWTNVTFYVWDNSTIVNQTTIDFTDDVVFNETVFIDNFTFKSYDWNAEACYINATDTYCVWSANNNTFEVSLFTIVNQTYTNDTIGGTSESFSITLSLLPGYELSDASFIYNGTDNSPSIYSQGDNRYLLISSYPIPSVLNDTNVTFNWDLTFTGGVMLSTTNVTQLVRAALLDDCSLYTNQLFNITLRDEQTKSLLLGDIEMTYTLLNKPIYSDINSYSFSATNISNINVCSGINLSSEDLAYSAEIRYVSEGYAPELYHIQRADTGTATQYITLYDLNLSDSTEFKITYQDDGFNFVEGAIIQLQRKYISEDLYEVVEAPLTSNEGVSVVHIDLDAVKYRATIVKNGVVLDEFDNLVFKCQSELTGECEQKLLGTIDPQNNINLDTGRDFSYSINRLLNVITLSFSIPSGTPSSTNMQLIQKDQFGSYEMCNQTILSSAGSISCTFNDTIGDSYIDLRIYKDGVPITIESFIIPEANGVDFLGNNFIIIVVLLLSVVGMALTSPEWIIINGIIVMVVAGALWLVNGLNFVMGLGSLMWLVIAAGILIFKLAKQEDR